MNREPQNFHSLIICLLFFISCAPLSAINISGNVKDDQGPLPTASVSVENRIDQGTECDERGHYSLNLPNGEYTLVCEFLGYKKERKTIKVHDKALKVNFKMEEDVQELDKVEIKGSWRAPITDVPEMSVSHLDVADLKKMPALFGEQNVIKSLQLMPGVKSESDASSGFQVRGGESSQNLVLLDGTTINNAGHMLGFFSAFNDDLLRDVTLYKGLMPAQFGGRISSVLDMSTLNGDNQNYQADGSVGLLASKLMIQGPIQKGKSSFVISGRRTYLDMFLKLTDDYKNTTLYFYDVNAKLNFNLGKKDNLSLSFFNGKDALGISNLMNMEWGNTTATGQWSHRFNDRLRLNSTLFHSHYKTQNWMEIMSNYYDYDGKIDQTALTENLSWQVNDQNELKFGYQTSWYDLITAHTRESDIDQKEERYAWENHFWVNDECNLTKRLSLTGGIRLAVFSVMGGSPYYDIDQEGEIIHTTTYNSKSDFIKTYCEWEPRLSANYKLTPQQSVKAAYSRTSQNIHTLKNGISSTPMDRYTFSTNSIQPETANQVSAGYSATLNSQGRKNAYEASAEVYYKKMNHVLDYRDGVTSGTEIEMDRLVLSGEGRSYGIELNLKKNLGKLTGWISYTLSQTQTRIDGINDGDWYTASNDRRHDVNIVALYSLNKKWDISASWVFQTGQAMSLPTAKYEINGTTLYKYDSRNNYRAPSYHRLDLSATLHLKEHKHWKHDLNFGLYNAYGRYNPFMISIEEDDESVTGTKATQTSLFSFVPSISYRFKFK